jgi:branched-chain amino acid transport system substrate-binding protein
MTRGPNATLRGRTAGALALLSLPGCLALAACSKSSPAPEQAPATTAPPPAAALAAGQRQGPTTGVSDAEIVVGEPAAFSGPSAGLGVEMWRGATAAFSEVNAAGGVGGRKIRLVVADDAYDAEKAAPAVVSLVQDSGAFVLFGGVGTPTIVRALPVVRKYFDEAGLFYFANFTGAQPQRKAPYSQIVFNVRASYYEETKAIVDAYSGVGKKKIGTFVQDDAYGTDGREGVKKALKDHALELAGDTSYPRGQKFDVSTTPQVKLLRDAGVDAVVMVGSYQACAAFVRDARRGGWTVPIAGVSFVGADQMLKLLVDEDKQGGGKLTANLINSQVVPYYKDTTIPAVRDYQAAIDKYKPTLPPIAAEGPYRSPSPYSFGSLEGYVSARALVRVLEKAGHDLTRQGAYKAAESLGSFDLGVGAKGELSPERHQVLDAVWFTAATPDGWKAVEKPASVLQ